MEFPGTEWRRSVTYMKTVAVLVGIMGPAVNISLRDVYQKVNDPYNICIGTLISGMFALFGGLCLAEIGTCIKKSGGEYMYIKETFGPLPAFIYLWGTVFFVRPFIAGLVALTFAKYAVPIIFLQPRPYSEELLACVCLCLITVCNIYSVSVTMGLQEVFAVARIIPLGLVVYDGFTLLLRGAFGESTELNKSVLTEKIDLNGWFTTRLSISLHNGLQIFEGWNYFTAFSEELKDPVRTVPRAVWLALPIITCFHILADIAFFVGFTRQKITATITSQNFGEHAFEKHGIGWIFTISTTLSSFGGINATFFTSSRLFYAASREGQIPSMFSFIHKETKTPHIALMFQCFIAIILLFSGLLTTFKPEVSLFILIFCAITVAALPVLRRSKPDVIRPVVVPLLLPYTYITWTVFMVVNSIINEEISTSAAYLPLTGVPAFFVIQYLLKAVPKKPQHIINTFLQKYMKAVIPDEMIPS